MKRYWFILSLLIIVIIALSIVRISLENSVSTTGIEIVQIQQKVDSLKKENTLLKEKYLEVASLTNIDKKAKTFGFVTAKSQIYLSTPLPLALKD